jgi:small GTP-binding protein
LYTKYEKEHDHLEKRMRILNEQQDALLKDERQLLNNLRLALGRFGASPQDLETLGKSIEQLDDLFLLVVVGEFNAGKSALINALLGQSLLKEGVTPTTTEINLLRYGESQSSSLIDRHQQVLSLPAALLSEISIVDTPGTNAILRTHEALTSEFVPRSDLVLFITSADRPFTESERAFMEKIRDWGKKVVIVINKIDILHRPGDLDEIVAFVSENARGLLGLTPEIFPLSARQALRAKLGEPELWALSRFEALESYIHDTLDESGRLRLKLLNPLGVGSHLVQGNLATVGSRLELLQDDFNLLNDVEAQLKVYQEDMQRDFALRTADMENVLYEMEQRGDAYFEETFRLARIFDLLSKDRIQREFEVQVIADAPAQVEKRTGQMIDWLVDSDLRQWRAVTEHLANRRRVHQERIVGGATSEGFHYDRERLVDNVGREAQRVVDTYDRAAEASGIAEGARQAVAASAAIEVGALGMGALITALATTMAADVTGILLASLVAVLGLFVIPARRRSAKKEMSTKVASLRERLVGALKIQFDGELSRSLAHINETIAPYTRFVRAERGKLADTRAELLAIQNGLERLKGSVEKI